MTCGYFKLDRRARVTVHVRPASRALTTAPVPLALRARSRIRQAAPRARFASADITLLLVPHAARRAPPADIKISWIQIGLWIDC